MPIATTTASTSSTAAATAGVAAAATTDSHWFQRLLNMGPPSAAPVAPAGSSMDVTGINPLLLQMIHMQQQSIQQMFMMQQQWMAHGY